MTTQEQLRKVCEQLPGSEPSRVPFSYGVQSGGKVKGYLWTWLERQTPKGKRIPNERFIALRTPGLHAKQMLLELNPAVFFTEDHYNGYPAVLVRLEECEISYLEEFIVEAWKCVAPKKVVKEWERDRRVQS